MMFYMKLLLPDRLVVIIIMLNYIVITVMPNEATCFQICIPGSGKFDCLVATFYPGK